MIRILRAADRVATPWKNGGGVTREVAVWPPGSDLNAFDWRISIAEVRDEGPFSLFENIDRTLTILEGRMALAFTDRTVELDAHNAPLAFPGDVPCFGTPLGGPVTDLNVMTKRGRCAAHVNRIAGEMKLPDARHIVVVAIMETAVRVDAESLTLQARDALLIENLTVHLSIGASALLIAFV
jgi:environmental stress-induced protein Ves